MDVIDVKIMKSETEKTICALIEHFIKKTGVNVSDIHIKMVDYYGDPSENKVIECWMEVGL